MIFLRFITVTRRTEDVFTRYVNILSLVVGSLSTVCLSLVANFPEGQIHDVGLVHEIGAGTVFTGGCVFMVIDTVVTLRARHVEVRDADGLQTSLMRSFRWFEWIRPIVATLAITAWLLCILYHMPSQHAKITYKLNLT